MPYVSDRQRRFFHTATARKHGITPEMVKEWDEASRKTPAESTEKSAAGALKGVSSGAHASAAPSVLKVPAAPKPLAPNPGPLATADAARENFVAASSAATQRAPTDLLQGNATMPVHR